MTGGAATGDRIVREAVVLAGGEASRLGGIAAAVPKCLQPVAGRPFLDHVLRELTRHGVRRVVFATGRLHDAVAAHVGDGSAFGIEAVYSLEPQPLGTAGALGLAARRLRGELAYVCNGDSLFDCNLLALAERLRALSDIDLVLGLRTVEDAGRFGTVELDAAGIVRTFWEKGRSGPGLVNAGVYCARVEALRALPDTPASLELDVFPRLSASGHLAGVSSRGFFVDIGLPESLAEAQESVARWLRRPCAFLDRDGVINVDSDYVHTPAEFEFTTGMPQAIRALNDAGWLVVVVTNQAGIGRGYYTEEEFAEFTAWIDGRLAEAGAHLDATYHCPHHPTAGVGVYLQDCACRKPRPGMLLRAIAEWQPDVARSVMIGDNRKDMEAAAAAGVRGILYRGGDLLALVRGLIDDDAAAAGESPLRTADEGADL